MPIPPCHRQRAAHRGSSASGVTVGRPSIRAAAACCVLAVVCLPWAAAPAAERRIPFLLELRNTTSAVIASANVGIFVPVQGAVGQRCCRQLEASQPFEVLTDGAGNQALRFRIERLAPHAVKVIRATAAVTLDPALQPSEAPELAAWLAAEPLIQSDAAPIRRLADRLRASSAEVTARRIHQWVGEHLRYSGYRRQARGALAALASKQGDCTEYMHLTTALARAAHLPTRPMAGYVLGAGALPKAAGLHNWAEVQVDARWRIADAQRGLLGDGAGRYLAVRVLTAAPTQPWPPAAVRFWTDTDTIAVSLR